MESETIVGHPADYAAPPKLPELIADRIRRLIIDVKSRQYTPAWIILGHNEWYELNRLVVRHGDGGAEFARSWEPGPATFRGIRVARVDLESHLEVTVEPRL